MLAATITLNPCLDRTLYIGGGLRKGEVNRAEYARLCAGGKGVNVSRMLRQLGVFAPAYGFAGGEEGRLFEELLKSSGIPYFLTGTACATRTCTKIVDADGLTTELNERGGPVTAEELKRLIKKSSEFAAVSLKYKKRAYLVVSGSLPEGAEPEIYRELLLENGRMGIRCVLDADGEALKRGLEGRPWLIKPNIHELSSYVGYPLQSREGAAKVSRRIQAEYGANVLCTMGAEGAVYTDEKGCLSVSAPKVKVKGESGAGDTFLAAFLYVYEKSGGDSASALLFAAAAAAAKIERTGSDMPGKKELLPYLQSVYIENVTV